MTATVLVRLPRGGMADVRVERLEHAIRTTSDDVPGWPRCHADAAGVLFGPVFMGARYLSRTPQGRIVVTCLFVPAIKEPS